MLFMGVVGLWPFMVGAQAVGQRVVLPDGSVWWVMAQHAASPGNGSMAGTTAGGPEVTTFWCENDQGNPAECWWGRTLKVRGCGFSPVARDNVIHLNPRPVHADSVTTTGSNCSGVPEQPERELVVNAIPEGVRSGYLQVSTQGVRGPVGAKMRIVTPHTDTPDTDITFQDIRSVIGIPPATGQPMEFVVISVEGSDVQAYQVSGLYTATPTKAQWWQAPATDAAPYGSRARQVGAGWEICWVQLNDHGQGAVPDVFCAQTGGPATAVAHLHGKRADGSPFGGPAIGQVRGIAQAADRSVFYVAYEYTPGSGWYRIERVARGNHPDASGSVDDVWGDQDFRIPFDSTRQARRVGLDVNDVGTLWLVAGPGTPGCAAPAGETCTMYIGPDETVGAGKIFPGVYEDVEIEWRWPDRIVWILDAVAALGVDDAHDLYGMVFATDDYRKLTLASNSAIYITRALRAYGVRRVVISSEPAGVQTALGWPEAEQVAPRVLRVDIQAGLDNHPVYIRVLDPADLAGYATGTPVADPAVCVPESSGGPWMQACDNQVWTDDAAVNDWGLCPDQNRCEDPTYVPARMLSVWSNGDGEAVVYLRMPPHYSGDNVVLQLRLAPFTDVHADDAVINYSEIITGWKRVVVEADRMFRYGGVLLVPWDVNCGGTSNPCNQVILHKWANVQVGDTIVIFTHPKVPGPISCRLADILPESHCAVHNVTDVQPVKVGSTDALKVTFDRRPDAPPEVTYCASDVDENGKPIFTNGCSAGVGVIARDGQDLGCTQWADTCFYQADLGDVDEPFFDAFTIVTRHPTGEGEGAVPYIRFMENGVAIRFLRFHQIWFHHRNPKTPDYLNHAQNYYHLVGAHRPGREDADTLGITNSASDISWVYTAQVKPKCDAVKQEAGIGMACTADEVQAWLRHTTAHEMVHQFHVNKENPQGTCQIWPPEDDPPGHDLNPAWCAGEAGCRLPQNVPLRCLMYGFTEARASAREVFWNKVKGILRLDCNDLLGSDRGAGLCGLPECHDHLRPRRDPN